MRKKQVFLYLGIFFTAILAMLGIAFGIRQAIRAGNLAGIDWYNIHDKEFVITTEEELYDLATLSDYYDFAGQTIKLGADIVVNEGNAEDWQENAPEKKWQPITEFAGTFDGQGHSISGLYGKSSSMSMGLFSETKKTCVIKDFRLLNSFFTNTTNNGLGSVLGEGAGKVQQVYSDAIIYGEGESNGGIAGLIKDELELKECWFDGQVIGVQRSNGGMIGWVDRKANVTIDNCLNSGLIKFIGTGSSKTGGFVGGISDIAYRTDVSEVTITNSLTTGEIDVTNTSMSGSAVGTVRQIGALTFNNTYAVVEVTDNAASEATIGTVNGKLTGNAVPRYRETLIGVGGYQWTNLDFDKYWSCVEGDTPILKCFAEDELSLAGVEKEVDTSWYKEGQTEFVLMDAPDLWGFAMLSANTNFEGVTIKLGADITINDSDSSTWKEQAPKYNWFPIYSFSGVFDGQEHTISGLYVYSNGRRMSLFQQVNANGSIANFSLVNSYVRGSYCIGAVVAHGGGNISNIYCDAVVENTGEHTGGILGAMNQNGTISNCWFDGEVHGGTSYTGGITSAAMSSMGVITHCLNTGDIYGGTKNSTGGLVGIVNNTLTLSDSLNAGKVDDTLSSNKNRTGSVIGRIFDSTETLTVTTNISSTYTTRESYETSIGQGFPASGAPAVNSLAELKGNEGYRRTLLNFEKYWAIDKDSHPTLQSFTDEIPALPTNVKRPIVADISWFDYDENVFVINTAEELYGFAQLTGKNDFEGKTVKLGKNITINTGNSASWGSSTPLNQWAAIHRFNGTFDGQGHTISGLFANDGLWKVGLFGDVPEKGVIKNVKVTNSYFEGRYHVGAIAGMLTNATMQGVYSDANIVVRKGHGGGLIGTMYESKVDNAWFAGSVKGDCNYIGGIASFISTTDTEKNTGSVLSNCLNTGTVNGVSNVGGIVGRVAAKGTIKYSLNAGTVTGAKNTGSIVGVVVNDDITSCNIAEGVYATKESSKKTVGNGGGRGAVIVNTTAELTGVGGYQRTILDFNKYWSIVETGTPILKKFGGTPVAIPNVARTTAPDTSWYNAKKNTFVLTDYADLYGLAVLAGEHDFAGKTIKLGGNIVANSGNAEDFKTNTPLNQLVPVSGFAGTFDGQGYTISGLSANNESAWYVGVIGKTAEGAVVKNVNVENSYLTGEYHIGSVVGSGNSVKIENVYSNAIMEATQGHLGGIVGSLGGESSVSNCWFNGSATSPGSYVGGITSFVGNDSKVTISHCLNTAPIKAKSNAAGIVGRVASELTLADSVNAALVNSMGAAGSVVGMITDDGKVTFDATYGVQGTGGRVVGKGSNFSGDAQLINEIYMSGTSGYTYTGLDYNNYWAALNGETPKLSYFSDKITGEKVSLSGVERKDTSWYDADKTSYVLNDRADLFGFSYLLNSGNTFAGKTVTLGKNIKVNDGDAADWAEGEEPTYKWMPIGSYEGHTSYTKSFAGTFNGKMHSISGLYTKNEGNANKMYNWCAGLFGRTAEGATVKNVEVLNSYFESPYYNGVVGHATGTTIDTVYTDAIVNATGGNSGGIAGAITGGNINNAWFAGSLTNAGQFTGGIVGVVNEKATVSNCLTTGTLKTTTKSNNNYIGGLVGGVNGNVLVTDSLSVPETISTAKNYCVGSVIGGVSKTAKATATNTYTLNSISKLTIGQQIKTEEIGAAVNRISACADLTGLNGYSLTKLDFAYYWVALAGKTPELMSFSEGTALAVDTSFRASTKWYTEASADAAGNAPGTAENPYVIYNKADLYGFAELVNDGTIFAGQHVELGADIAVNVTNASTWADEAPNYAWEPIGSYVGHSDYSKSFAGNFDGKGYSISGLYTKKNGADNNMNSWCAGLFGRTADGATVKNVKVENSYFESAYYNGVIGHATNTIIENVYTDAIVNATSGNSGGIVGALTGGSVEGAWFAGTITSKGQFIGGIAGLASGDASINNCLTTGTVKSTYASTNAYAGGLVGGATGNMSLTNSLSAAKEVSATANRSGAAFGSANAANLVVTMDDVYVIAGIHKFAVGQNADKTHTGTYTEHPWVMPTLDGYNGYTLTKLDFDNTWVALEGTSPELKVFSEGTALNVADSFRPDTTWAGAGTEADPYVISTKAELYGLAEAVNDGNDFAGKYFVLGADIEVNGGTAADWATSAPAQAWNPIGYYNVRTKESKHFAGIFDGKMHTISGLYMDATKDDVNIGGLFVDTTAVTIKNLKLTNSYISAAEGTAAIAGWNNGGTFDTIYTDAIVKSTKNHPSGIVALIDEAGSIINNCWFDGQVSGKQYVGGILSLNWIDNVTISNSLVTGTISSTSTHTGGIIGWGQNLATIDNVLVACKEEINTTATKNVGAIAGNLKTGSTVTDVYATKATYDVAIAAGAGSSSVKVSDDLSGVKGYLLTTLDFDNYWVAKTDSTPLLKSFADADDANVIDANEWYTKATGTKEDPYVLSNVIELYSFAKKVNAGNTFEGKYVTLGADITVNTGDAATWATTTPEYSWTAIGTTTNPFKGNFDGKMYTISGLYSVTSQNTRSTWYNGLFGYTDGATIGNLKVTNSYIQAANYAGVVGYANASAIDTVYSSVIVNIFENGGSAGGGIVGQMAGEGTISNCWFDGQIASTGRYLGGILGVDGGAASIEHCLVTGSISTTCTSGNVYTGGLLGLARTDVKITDCLVVAREMSTSKTGCYGSVIGSIGDLKKQSFVTTVQDVYVLDGIGNTTVPVGRTAYEGGTMSGAPEECQNLTGEAAYMSTKLDFVNTWVLMKDSTPVLKSFVEDDANIIDVDAWCTTEAAGTETDPYIIDTAAELYNLAVRVNSGQNDFSGKYIVLGNDITINSGSPSDGWETAAPAYKWNPIGTNVSNTFKGNFNVTGEIREIKGLYVNTGSGNFAGLFGSVTDGTVKNIKVTDSYIQGNQFVGGIAGFANNATIDTVYTNAKVKGTAASGSTNTGGVLGYQVKGTVRNTWFDGTVTGTGATQYVGGVVGRTTDSNGAVIDNCLATGTVTSGRTSGNAYAGGILGGATRNTTVSNCFSALKSPLTAKGATGCIGSVVGGSGTKGYTLTVTNCYAASGVASKANGTGGNGTLTGTSTVLEAYTGADGYLNTKLVFDRPETTDVVEGYWVARKDASPALGSFVATGDVYDLSGQFRTDTEWANSPVVEKIDGVDTNTYTITRPEQLAGLASLVNAGTKLFDGEVIYLENDIVFNTGKASDWKAKAPTYSWTAIGTTSKQFQGTFTSKDEIYEISGLYSVTSQSSKTTWYNGLFGYTDGAEVSNLKVTNSYFAGQNYVGVVGFANNTKIDTVYTDAIVNITANGGSAGGGIAGYMSGEGTINNCWFDGTIDSVGRYLGGILGIDGGTASITNCLVTGSIKTTCTSGNIYTGGLLGLARTDVQIADCLVAAREMSTSKTGCYGSVIGSIGDLKNQSFVTSVERVYVLDGIGNTTAPVGRTAYSGGTMSGAPIENEVAYFTGVNGYKNTALTFGETGYWVATETTPVLKTFVDLWNAKEVDITGVTR